MAERTRGGEDTGLRYKVSKSAADLPKTILKVLLLPPTKTIPRSDVLPQNVVLGCTYSPSTEKTCSKMWRRKVENPSTILKMTFCYLLLMGQ